MKEKKIILISHGRLSEGMYHSVTMIVGENKQLSYLGMMEGENPSVVSDRVKEMAIQEPETQFIVIADLFGGSVCNACISLLNYQNIKLLAGMNMGLVIELLLAPQPLSDQEISEKIQVTNEGIKYITPSIFQDAKQEDNFFEEDEL